MSSDKKIHYYPDAMLIFVKGFRGEVIDPEDVIIARKTGDDIQEISSVAVTLTIQNNPGNFRATLVDNNNKFIEPDDPVGEIPELFERSNRLPKIFASDRKQIKNAGANYYEFNSVESWENFENTVLVDRDTGERSPTHYRRDRNGNVTERWAFNKATDVILVSDATNEQEFAALPSGENWSTTVLTPDNNRITKTFIVFKHRNDEFFTKYKDNAEQSPSFNKYEFKRGKCKIRSMDRVMIFLSKRFDQNGNMHQGPSPLLMRVFTGIVGTVQQSYNENDHTINITGDDVTKLMQLSVINVNPSLLVDETINPDEAAEETLPINIWSNIFANKRAPEIIKLLTTGGTTDGDARRISAIGSYALSSGYKTTDLYYDVEKDQFVEQDPDVKPQGDPNFGRRANFREMLGDLFTDQTVHIVDPFNLQRGGVEGFRPYEISLQGNWGFYQTDFRTRREIAYEIADDSHFHFYADRNGHIWFRPPRFNNAHILGAANPKVYIMDNESIESYGFVEDDANVYSSIYVSTEPNFGEEGLEELAFFRGAYRDEATMLRYGQRIITVSNPIIQAKDRESIVLYAKSLLQRMLGNKLQGQITISGRPEIEPGMPVYIPIRNMIYYIETVDHNLVYGSQYNTTLHLVHGRKPWELLPEVLAFSANDHIGWGDLLPRHREDITEGDPDIRENQNIQYIVIHTERSTLLRHSVDSIFKRYADQSDIGPPYDVIIERDGTINLTFQWMLPGWDLSPTKQGPPKTAFVDYGYPIGGPRYREKTENLDAPQRPGHGQRAHPKNILDYDRHHRAQLLSDGSIPTNRVDNAIHIAVMIPYGDILFGALALNPGLTRVIEFIQRNANKLHPNIATNSVEVGPNVPGEYRGVLSKELMKSVQQRREQFTAPGSTW